MCKLAAGRGRKEEHYHVLKEIWNLIITLTRISRLFSLSYFSLRNLVYFFYLSSHTKLTNQKREEKKNDLKTYKTKVRFHIVFLLVLEYFAKKISFSTFLPYDIWLLLMKTALKSVSPIGTKALLFKLCRIMYQNLCLYFPQ